MIKPGSFVTVVFILLFPLVIITSCGEHKPLIANPQRLADIDSMLNVQKALTKNSKTDIWETFDENLTTDELQAMKFLYAYMPLSDLADYSSEFFLGNVKRTLEARTNTSWGSSIPEDVFLHFVLPLRVNNENLDSFRMVMYPEIMNRIKGLSMKDAALEINHWCHEKVTYRGTDARTSAPLSTINKSFGRCGEESTFTVAAMRTAGIPARQVYTPRWAHSDDNHAWVEVWVEGKWYYLGACEPEPDLNMGWFSEPARRTMLVHTRAYGRYFGKEEVVTANERFSELNLTSNYATVKDIFVKVISEEGLAVDSTKVEFKLYNYAEYFSIATAFTDKKGLTHLKTGLGDLLVWGSKNGKFAYKKFSVPDADRLTLILTPDNKKPYSDIFDMVPPHAVKISSTVNKEDRIKNDKLLAREDSIRNSYMATFKDSAWAASLAFKLRLSPDTVRPFITKSYGNWREISLFLERNSEKYRHYLLPFASQLSDKDLSDTKETLLSDHLEVAMTTRKLPDIPNDIFIKYVLSPRIAPEFLSAWRGFLQKNLGVKIGLAATKDISVLTDWIRKNIKIDNNSNLHSRTPLSPIGVYNLGVANSISRDIFFVAACRTFGIPARLNPETQVPEYWKNGKWMLAGFEPTSTVQPVTGNLELVSGNNSMEPQYYNHFTIAKVTGGAYKTLEFDEGKKLSDFSTVVIDTGRYVLVTGNRLEDGTVLSSVSFFNIRRNTKTIVPVELRQISGGIQSKGKLKFAALKIRKDKKVQTLSDVVLSNDVVIILIDPDKEPSKHILNDLGPYVDHFNKWSGVFVIAIPEGKNWQPQILKTYTLPQKVVSGTDVNNELLRAASDIFGSDLKEKLPLVLVCNSEGSIYLFSAGYKIGAGEQILKVTPALAKAKKSCTRS